METTVYILLRSIIVYLKPKIYYLGNYCSYFISRNNNRFSTKRWKNSMSLKLLFIYYFIPLHNNTFSNKKLITLETTIYFLLRSIIIDLKKIITSETTVYILLRFIIINLKKKTFCLGNYYLYFTLLHNNRFSKRKTEKNSRSLMLLFIFYCSP